MSQPKPVASLAPNLLARKGAARPGMRPQVQPLAGPDAASEQELEDLGWNDFGSGSDDPTGHGTGSIESWEIEGDANGIPCAAELMVSARQAPQRYALTLRLDAERHLQLRLASILENCSGQQLVMQALDRFVLWEKRKTVGDCRF